MKIKHSFGNTAYEIQIKSKIEDAVRKEQRKLKGMMEKIETISNGGAPGMVADKAKDYLRGKVNPKCLKIYDDLVAIQNGAEKAVKYTVSDTKSRAPGWVAQVVTGVYNIKKTEITPSQGKNAKPKKMAGSIRVKGDTIESMTLVYTGRPLTPVRFGMTPKSPPKGKKYTLKMQVYKGKPEVIGRYSNTRTPGGPFAKRSHNILMGTGNTKEGGVGYIPFQRMSENRNDLRKFTTVSVPQMITSEAVAPLLQERLNQEVGKRFDHNMKRQLGMSPR